MVCWRRLPSQPDTRFPAAIAGRARPLQPTPGQRQDDDDDAHGIRVDGVLCRARGRGDDRPARSMEPGPSATRRSARTTTSRSRPASGCPIARSRSRASRSGSSAARIDVVTDLGFENENFPDFRVVLRPAQEVQVPVRLHADQVRGRDHPHPHDRLQRPGVRRRPPGQLPARVEGLALRDRVGLHLPRSRLPRVHHRGEVHRRGGGPREPDHGGVHQGQGARPHLRAGRPRLPAQEPVGDRRGHRARAEHLRQRRHLHQLRPVRHLQLHQQLRRAGRLPDAEGRLHGGARRGQPAAEGASFVGAVARF